jgi:hypothetical protein
MFAIFVTFKGKKSIEKKIKKGSDCIKKNIEKKINFELKKKYYLCIGRENVDKNIPEFLRSHARRLLSRLKKE